MSFISQVIFETLKNKKTPPFWLCPALGKEAVLRISCKSAQSLKMFVFKFCPECKSSLLVLLAVLFWSGRIVAKVLKTNSQMWLSLPVFSRCHLMFFPVLNCWTVTLLFECCFRKCSEPFSPQMLKCWWCFQSDTGFGLLDPPVRDRWAQLQPLFYKQEELFIWLVLLLVIIEMWLHFICGNAVNPDTDNLPWEWDCSHRISFTSCLITRTSC